ncbi:MAG: substrate-binding domain-containing protein [Rickettsiales bacterium]|nr:substrate-binding domain-containing protein [Rickettsiales bacterium]
MKKLLFAIAILLASASNSEAREQIRIVGSSTVYPFATVVAEEFGTKTDFRTPIVESTGTGGGMKLFCSGAGFEFPDITNASRKIKESEAELCKSNGVNNIKEIKIGYDGIVLANSKEVTAYTLTKEQIFKALAKRVPVDGKLVENPYKNWSDVDASLPNNKIEVYGPPPTSGTRDAFVEIVMEPSCLNIKEFVAEYPDEEIRRKNCHEIREDGAYIESGENDNLIVQKLKNNTNSLGIFGFSFLDQNSDTIQGSTIDGATPEFDNIHSGKYSVSRSLYMYVKGEHIGKVAGLKEFLNELVSEDAIGDTGYLSLKGLIPLKEEDRKNLRDSLLK